MTVSHGFELLRERRLPELASLARLYRHERTGAELLSILNDDENKVFAVSFRTPPADSTGVAHILEHSVLCGSRRYPVKAPFLELVKSSLKTFLNAMTYPDKTVYPVASQNLQDFYNLVDVYLDAVLHPLITPDILRQEGWHYEIDEAEGSLRYKGVVFNEMKGAYSSPDSLAFRISQQSLYPDTTYGVSSGGDPKDIPDLTYEAFKAFHERCYHPSNARLFFYGNDDPERRLKWLEERLAGFSPAAIDASVALQPRFAAPRRLQRSFASSAAAQGRQARVCVNWMLDEFSEGKIELAWSLLEEILVGTPASPLRKALIDSGLGDGLTMSGLVDSLRQPMFTVGLKGADDADGEKIEALIFATLEELAAGGLDPLTIEAAVNTLEFRLRENNSGSIPRGLAVLGRALTPWNYGHDPLAALAWEAPLAAIKSDLAKGERLFEDLIRRWLIDNLHRTTTLFTPDAQQGAREVAEERARLDQAWAAMNDDQRKVVVEQMQALKRRQETPDTPGALATIPVLTLKDLPARGASLPVAETSADGTRVFTHDLATNGVIYLDVGLDLRTLPPELTPWVGLFSRALLETGAGDQDFVQLSQRIGRFTGGIRAQDWTSAIIGSDRAAAWLFLRAKAVPEKAGEMLAILRDVLLGARLDDHRRVGQLAREQKTVLEAQLIPMGHAFAVRRLRAAHGEAGWAAEQMGGVSQLAFLRRLGGERPATEGDEATRALSAMRNILVNRSSLLCNVTADGESLRRFEPQLARFLDTLPSGASAQPAWPACDLPRFEGLAIPARVNYVAKGANLYKLGFRPGGAALVARQHLGMAWLWEKVRVQGGAYGASCAFDVLSGDFTFSSYRDPNLLRTLEAFDGSASFLRTAPLDESELTRSIIGTIGAIDACLLPDAKGLTSLQRVLTGESDARRQRLREEALGASAADLRAFADALDAVAREGRVAALGSSEALAEANAERGGWLSLSSAL